MIPNGNLSFGPNEPQGARADVQELKAEATSPVVAAATARIVAGLLATIACLLVLGAIAASIRQHELNALDAAVTPFLHGLASPSIDTFMEGASFLASDGVLAVLFLVALISLIWLSRPRGEWLFLAAALGGSLALNQVMKLIFQRARPQLAWAHIQADYSFPSGHSMNSFVFYVSIALLMWGIGGRRAGLLAITGALILVMAVGVSRIYLGYHYFTDVVGGYAGGLLWLLILAASFQMSPRLRQRWRTLRNPPGDGA